MTAHRHMDTLPLGSRPRKVERRRDVQRFQPAWPAGGAPTTRSAAKPRPSSLAPPPGSARRTLFHPREAEQSSSDTPALAGPPAEGPAPQDPPVVPKATDPGPVNVDMRVDTRDASRDPPEAPRETDTEPVHVGMQGDTRDAPPPAAGPMETDEPSSDGQARLPSQPTTPRSLPRTTASTHPSGMWFCPVPRCARREGVSPTGTSCLQSLVSHLRFVHISTGVASPDASLDAYGLRVCLACREITPQGARCPGPHCYTAVLAALELGNTAPPPSTGTLATGRASPGGPGPGTPTGHPDFHAAQDPHRGLLHRRPGTYLPATGPGTGVDMGDPGPPSPIPPHRPRSSRTGWQGEEVLFDPAMPAQLPAALWTHWGN